MGRGTRANRLGDHHSSDGEHEADAEAEPHCGRDDADADADEESGPEMLATPSTSREMADEADEVLAAQEREERSVMGSVY
jgi:hypothetical protein